MEGLTVRAPRVVKAMLEYPVELRLSDRSKLCNERFKFAVECHGDGKVCISKMFFALPGAVVDDIVDKEKASCMNKTCPGK